MTGYSCDECGFVFDETEVDKCECPRCHSLMLTKLVSAEKGETQNEVYDSEMQ